MKKPTCIIIEDEYIAVEIVKDYVEKSNLLLLKDSFASPVEALSFLTQEEVDIIFLDIRMPEMTGMEFLKILNRKPLVICTTASKEYAIEAFEHSIVDYLLKPISYERFLAGVYKALSILKTKSATLNDDHFITIKSNKAFYRVKHSEILYIEGMKDYLKVHCKNNQYITLSTQREMMAKLHEHNFVRINKSLIVNLQNVTKFNGDAITVQNKELPVANAYKQTIKDFFLY